MRIACLLLVAGILAGVPVVVLVEGADPPTAPAFKEDAGRDADLAAIRRSSGEFADAFAKGDAQAAAAAWTADGEYQEEGGPVLRGRSAIEKAFAELFKDKSQGQLKVEVWSIRFPSRDTAIEEGFLRHTPAAAGLPSSTQYSAVHVREDGKWKVALSREWGAGEDRLGDLAWLIGTWEGGPKGQEVGFSFEKEPTVPFIVGRFTKKADDQGTITGTMRIGLDTRRGQLHSWHFDADGGHGECLWVRDGNRYVLDAIGVLGDGTQTEAVNILARLGNDEFTWRSIDRVAGGEPLPDSVPVKLTRVRQSR